MTRATTPVKVPSVGTPKAPVKRAPKAVKAPSVKAPAYVLPTKLEITDASYKRVMSILSNPQDQTLKGWIAGTLSVSHGQVDTLIGAVRRSDSAGDSVRFLAAAAVAASKDGSTLAGFAAGLSRPNGKPYSKQDASKWAQVGRIIAAGRLGTFTPVQVLAAVNLKPEPILKALESGKPDVTESAIARVRNARKSVKAPAKGKDDAPDKGSETLPVTIGRALNVMDAGALAKASTEDLQALTTMLAKASTSAAVALKARQAKPGPVA